MVNMMGYLSVAAVVVVVFTVYSSADQRVESISHHNPRTTDADQLTDRRRPKTDTADDSLTPAVNDDSLARTTRVVSDADDTIDHHDRSSSDNDAATDDDSSPDIDSKSDVTSGPHVEDVDLDSMVDVPVSDKVLSKLVNSGEHYTVRKGADGKAAVKKESETSKRYFCRKLKNAIVSKLRPLVKDVEDAVDRSNAGKDQTEDEKDASSGYKYDLYNYAAYESGVAVSFSTLEGLMSLEVEVNSKKEVTVGAAIGPAEIKASKELIMPGVKVPGTAPFVKLSARAIYSTADRKFIGAMLKGGLDFVFFSAEYVGLYQDGHPVKDFSKIQILCLSVVRSEERVGGEMTPVTKDVYFEIRAPARLVNLQVTKTVSTYISQVFEGFGKDWVGEYEMNTKHKDLAGIVAGWEPKNPNPSKVKIILKKLMKMCRRKNKKNMEEPVKLLSIKKLDDATGQWKVVNTATDDIKSSETCDRSTGLLAQLPLKPEFSLTAEELLNDGAAEQQRPDAPQYLRSKLHR